MQQTLLDIDLRTLNLKHPPLFNKVDHIKYVNDWRGQYKGQAAAILKPINTDEVSSILRFAHENNVDVVPQGGNTSLCGAATPDDSGRSIIISLEKMNNVRQFNKAAQTITVESGMVLSQIHEIVENDNLFFPLSLGAQGSCMIGGNLSTNAGGVNVLKYGNTRELCLGLEVVLPDGKIMNLLSELKKDNTGYDLKNIFIGAEGPKNVAQTCEIADGWLPLYYSPYRQDVYSEVISNRKDTFEIPLNMIVNVTDDIETGLLPIKMSIALYIGGMGAKGKNFHTELMSRMGFEAEAKRIQDLFLEGKREKAIASVPSDFCDEISLVGSADRIRDRLQAFEDSPICLLYTSPSPRD